MSCAFAQSDLMQKEVYLFERLDSTALRYSVNLQNFRTDYQRFQIINWKATVSNNQNVLYDVTYNQCCSEPIKHLKCIAFLRPTPENLRLLTDELRFPKYGQYYICKFRHRLLLAVVQHVISWLNLRRNSKKLIHLCECSVVFHSFTFWAKLNCFFDRASGTL